ncbi:MAG: DNA-directed RNA polymerase subunit H [Candidatus Heimdallarchaeota archaeon]|nr:DNA-directed RNA polymerase subunit H [Candidatus Heimdallarchaeota archaeon]
MSKNWRLQAVNGRRDRVIDGAKSILDTRGYTVTSEGEKDECYDILGKDANKKTIIVRIPNKEVVGVRELRDFKEVIEDKGYDNAILLALNKYTHYAKREAKAAGIETFSIKFPFFNLFNHYLVPLHEFASDDEIKVLEEKFSIFKYQLPKISSDDPAVQLLGAKIGDVLKIIRSSPTAGEFVIFRTVVP